MIYNFINTSRIKLGSHGRVVPIGRHVLEPNPYLESLYQSSIGSLSEAYIDCTEMTFLPVKIIDSTGYRLSRTFLYIDSAGYNF